MGDMVPAEEFPDAVIWSPTQRDRKHRWDIGSELGVGQLFVFESKASIHPKIGPPDPKNNRVDIDVDQLEWYLGSSIGDHVYYILPFPPFGRPASQSVPAEAASRIPGQWAPCDQWLYVAPARLLHAELITAATKQRLAWPKFRTLSSLYTLNQFCSAVKKGDHQLNGLQIGGLGMPATSSDPKEWLADSESLADSHGLARARRAAANPTPIAMFLRR